MPYTWSPPSDTELAIGKYYTSSKAKRVRDMCRAIAEGASGADRIQTAAIQDNAVTLAKLAHGTANQYVGYDDSGAPINKAIPNYAPLNRMTMAVVEATTATSTYDTSSQIDAWMRNDGAGWAPWLNVYSSLSNASHVLDSVGTKWNLSGYYDTSMGRYTLCAQKDGLGVSYSLAGATWTTICQATNENVQVKADYFMATGVVYVRLTFRARNTAHVSFSLTRWG